VTSACYDVEISHRRSEPFSYGFTFRSRIWLIDLDEVPALPAGLGWLCRFEAADHSDRGGRTLRGLLEEWLAEHGIAAPERILMLGNPRVLGYVFNPLTVFYCLDARGVVSHLVAEVRNTYGGRHRYLLRPGADGTAHADKAFYVSPFYPVEGTYQLRLPLPAERLLVQIRLQRPGERPFTAVLTGARRSGRPRLWTALRTPLASRLVMLAIKRHGIALYLKGLRPVSRTTSASACSPTAGPPTAGPPTAGPPTAGPPTAGPRGLARPGLALPDLLPPQSA
jgi:uncharacterized protein